MYWTHWKTFDEKKTLSKYKGYIKYDIIIVLIIISSLFIALSFMRRKLNKNNH
jgi:hypothetical protein